MKSRSDAGVRAEIGRNKDFPGSVTGSTMLTYFVVSSIRRACKVPCSERSCRQNVTGWRKSSRDYRSCLDTGNEDESV